MKNILILLFCIVSIACKEKSEADQNIDLSLKNATTAEKIAERNGIKYWDSVSEIKFTFNVDRGESHFERSWIWKPKVNEITLFTINDTLTYNQLNLDSISKRADESFINDKYWMLAPFNLV